VQKRLRQIESAAGERAKQFFNIEAYPQCENEMHTMLSEYRTVGEYFNCSYKEAVKLLQKISVMYNEEFSFASDRMSEKIKILLIKKNITLKDLCEKIGTKPSNLSNKLKRDNFSEKELKEIAQALDCEYSANFTIKSTGEII